MAHYGPGGQLAGQVANKSNILSCTRVKYSENPASTESETLPLRVNLRVHRVHGHSSHIASAAAGDRRGCQVHH